MKRDGEPKLTRFTVLQLSHNHYFDISAAKNELGYQPLIPPEEALKKTIEYFKEKLK